MNKQGKTLPGEVFRSNSKCFMSNVSSQVNANSCLSFQLSTASDQKTSFFSTCASEENAKVVLRV